MLRFSTQCNGLPPGCLDFIYKASSPRTRTSEAIRARSSCRLIQVDGYNIHPCNVSSAKAAFNSFVTTQPVKSLLF
jgi:hypothetical protein